LGEVVPEGGEEPLVVVEVVLPQEEVPGELLCRQQVVDVRCGREGGGGRWEAVWLGTDDVGQGLADCFDGLTDAEGSRRRLDDVDRTPEGGWDATG